jgi:hypothetical protein
MARNEVNMNNSVKWSWFKVPVKVKQINLNLFPDITKSYNTKQWMTWGWMIAKWQWDKATKPGQFQRYSSIPEISKIPDNSVYSFTKNYKWGPKFSAITTYKLPFIISANCRLRCLHGLLRALLAQQIANEPGNVKRRVFWLYTLYNTLQEPQSKKYSLNEFLCIKP